MRRSVLALLVLAACGSPPAGTCRSNDDCPIDRVCLAGACSTPSGLDAGERDSGRIEDGGRPDVISFGDAFVEPLVDSAGTDAWRVDTGPGVLPGESCADPILLEPVAPDGENPTATWTGEIAAYGDHGYPDCTGPDIGAPDVFFEIVRPDDERDIIITTSPADVDLVMAVDGACDDGHLAWVCNDDRDADPGGGGDLSAALFLWHYRPSVSEHLYLIVDGGRATTNGEITVQVEVRAASSTNCTGPLDLSGGGSVLAFPSDTAPSNQGDCTTVVAGDVLFRIGNGTAPAGRFGVESSDYPVSLRLIDPTCATSSMCVATMGSASYHFTTLGPVAATGFGYVAVEGITSRADGTFQLDYNP